MKTIKPRKRIRVHASQFYNYAQCPARVYLNIYGDHSKKLKVSDFMQKKMEEGLLHEKDVIADKDFKEVKAENDHEAFKKTVEMMKQGVELIYQGVLIHDNMIGRPDILEKRRGKSDLGDHHYIACDIKSGKHLKEEYRLQVTFYSHLLELLQGRLPSTGIIINSEKKELDFSIKEEIDNFYDVMREVKTICEGKRIEPSVSSRCAECVWREYCYGYAEGKQDISLIYKLSRVHKEGLNEAGIKTLKDAAELDVKRLLRIKGLGETTLNRFRLQARALLEGKQIVMHKPRIEDAGTEIFFDIEGETELGIDYLYGALVRKDGKEKYYCFWTDSPDDEEKMWKEFCRFMVGLDDYKIYYYTHYETTSLKRLKEKYGMNERLYGKMMDNMVDLFKVVAGHVIVPLYSYSIKQIAKHLGFKWSDEKAGGTQSMLWYQEWLEKRNKKMKERIIEYNKNDCEATKVVLDWLKGLEKPDDQEK